MEINEMSKLLERATKHAWIDRVIATHNFHISQVKTDSRWRMLDTATVLGRSLGSISQDIMLATWLKTNENQLRRFKRISEALEWVKEKQNESKLHMIQ